MSDPTTLPSSGDEPAISPQRVRLRALHLLDKSERTAGELRALLIRAGYPADLADIMAKQLRSPRAMDRMTSYVSHGYARSMEMLADGSSF